jgi:hypothetical protein
MLIRRSQTLLAAAVLGAVLITGCTGGGADPAAAPTADGVQRPSVGECRTYDAVAAEAPVEDSSPVSCEDVHTAETIAVIDGLPAPSKDGAWTDEQLSTAARLGCNATVHADALSVRPTALATTRLTQTFFAPTAAQARAGARWLRCDSVVFDGGDPSLVTGRHRALLDSPGAFALCAPKPPADAFTAVRCGTADDATAPLYAAVGAVDLTPYASAPAGTAANEARAAVTQKCEAAVSAASDSDDPRWTTTFPTEGVAGEDVARCWLRVEDWKLRAEASWPTEEPLGAGVAA